MVQRRDLPEEIPEFVEPSLATSFDGESRRLSNIIVDAGLATSAAEAKRLINQGAVQLITESAGDSRTFEQDDQAAGLGLEHRSVLKVGRRRFVRLVNS